MEPLKAGLLLTSRWIEAFTLQCLNAGFTTFEEFCSASTNSFVYQVNKMRSMLSLALLYIMKEDFCVHDLANFHLTYFSRMMLNTWHQQKDAQYVCFKFLCCGFCHLVSCNYFFCLIFKMCFCSSEEQQIWFFLKTFPYRITYKNLLKACLIVSFLVMVCFYFVFPETANYKAIKHMKILPVFRV